MFRLLFIAASAAGICLSLPEAVTAGGWYWAALVVSLFAFTRRKGATVFEGSWLYLLGELASVFALTWALPQAVASPENTTAWAVLLASLWLSGWQAEDPFGLRLEKDWQMQLASIVAAAGGLYLLLPICANATADKLQWGLMLLCLWVYTRRPAAPADLATLPRQRPPLEDAGVPAQLPRTSPSLREAAVR